MNIKDVNDSFGRCCTNPKFFDRFYDIFLASHPAIKPMFAHTDFVKQKSLLRQGLAMMLLHLDGKTVGTMALNRIGDSHSPKRMNINPQMYQFWIDSLVKAVKECDPQCSPALEAAWQHALRSGVDYIIAQGAKAA